MKRFPEIQLYSLLGLLVLAGLYLCSLSSFLLFHALAEIFSIVVACGVFMVAWNSREFHQNNYLLFIGTGYLFTAGLDVLHTLAYKNMGVFPASEESNLATQLWIAARYMESLTLLTAPLFLNRKIKNGPLFAVYSAAFALLIAAIFQWNIFPDCFLPGKGLTVFKKISEYIIALLLVCSMIFLLRRRRHFDPAVLALLISSVVFTIASELAFTLYFDVYGAANLIGHFLKIVSFFLIYRAIIHTGFMQPYRIIFRKLARREAALQKAKASLELRDRERTTELQQEIDDRQRAEVALRESEFKYSTLVEASLTGVYIEQANKIQFANQRFAEIYGYSREEITGIESWRLVHPADRTMVQDFRQKRIRGEHAPSEYAARGLTKDGRTVWVMRRNTLIAFQQKPAILGNQVDITEQKQAETALKESQKALRALSARLLVAEEKERRRIANELHDGIGQSLSAIKFSIENTLAQIHQGAVDAASQGLATMIELTRETIEETRRVVMDLRPSTLDDLGILPTIGWLCREFQSLHPSLRIEQDVAVEETDVPDTLKTPIYRILQEALNNIIKHSQAGKVRIALRKSDGKLEIEIEDNGQGFNLADTAPSLASKTGFGLVSMRERTEMLGGVFFINSAEGAGTTIRVAWPLEEDGSSRISVKDEHVS